MIRRARGLAIVTALAMAGVGFAAAPASANTNFNGVCESAEACNFRLSGWDRNTGIWDFEGTDHDFRNNYYAYGSSANLDNRGTSFAGLGQRCTAVFSNGYGDPANDSEKIPLPPGWLADTAGTSYDNSASQLWWIC